MSSLEVNSALALATQMADATHEMCSVRVGQTLFGIPITHILEIDYEPNPSTLDARRRTLFDGTYKLKDSLLVMLDAERLDPMRLCEVAA
jgi:chemotaxis signal transduction protein